jgi:uncharacterized protein (TIGR02145 family)
MPISKADDHASAAANEQVSISGSHKAVLALSIPLLLVSDSCTTNRSRRDGEVSDPTTFSTRMPDGRRWTTGNLNLDIPESYCYADEEPNCRRYGRLYTWEAAQLGCQSLGDGWRLPTNDDWLRVAKHYGGTRDESADTGRAAYRALSVGGSSGFNALLGGGRSPDGAQYARLDAHGFYWTASETGPSTAWFYNFGKGQMSLGRHSDGEKQRAFSVRCVSD